MNKSGILNILTLFFVFTLSIINVSGTDNLKTTEGQEDEEIVQDTMILNQLFYNGRVWVGLYYAVYGTEYIFSDDWIKADISVGGILFKDVSLKYDIYNDEIHANYLNKKILILNNERISGFKLYSDSREYYFTSKDSMPDLGFLQVLYEGESCLYKKWRKKRVQFAIEAKYDEFQPDNSVYMLQDGSMNEINGKKSLLKTLGKHKDEIKSFMKREKIKFDINSPETIIPLLKYYDTL